MAKLAPRDLAQVLSKLPIQNFSKDVLVGFETADDAGVFKLSDELALVQTVDFFTPVADDPEIYGRIAGINCLNDIYAMGGTPISALSIVCFPQKGDWDTLNKIMLGGQKALNNENVVVLGGHSIDDTEIKFGYAVTGTIHPNEIIRNSTAKEGDMLILTKPIGTGVISTGIKFEKANKESKKSAMKIMTTSSREASKIMRKYKANACTDITGFGLLGHAYEMSKGSAVTFSIESDTIPLLPGVMELIKNKMLTRGDKNNREYVGNAVRFAKKVTPEMQSALFDPQTAGGLLISISSDKAQQFIQELKGSIIIGRVKPLKNVFIEVN